MSDHNRNGEATTRLVILAALLTSLVACGGNQKFTSLDQAGQALQAAVDTNVTFARYNELVLAFNTELTGSTEKVTDERDASLLNLYGAALSSHTDALTLWMLKQQRNTDLLEQHPVLDNIVKKYEVPLEDDMIPVETTIKKIWVIAKVQLEMANARFNGR